MNPIKTKKHWWKRDENGEIDVIAWYKGFHNGPVCEVCGETPCMHCHPDYDEDETCIEHYVCGCGCLLKYEFNFCPRCGERIEWPE